LSSHRASIRWINNGDEEKQIASNDPVPEGWHRGRSKSFRKNRSGSWQHLSVEERRRIMHERRWKTKSEFPNVINDLEQPS
jgi:hypothetical protein